MLGTLVRRGRRPEYTMWQLRPEDALLKEELIGDLIDLAWVERIREKRKKVRCAHMWHSVDAIPVALKREKKVFLSEECEHESTGFVGY
eukprot:1679078-Amphidinium_carterae.2